MYKISDKVIRFIKEGMKNKKVELNNKVKIKETKKGRQILEQYQRTKKVVEHEGDSFTNCNWQAWNGP